MKKLLSVLLTIILLSSVIVIDASFLTASAVTSGYYTYYVLPDGGVAITGVDESISGKITIPSTLGGHPVTRIGHSAFEDCSGITRITIPDGIISMDIAAFKDCSSLTAVNYNATNCENMGNEEYPVFQGCDKLTTLKIGDNVKSIPNYAFKDCFSLTSVTIGKGVARIGTGAFAGCKSIKKITLPFVGQNADGTGYSNLGYIFGADNTTNPEHDNFKCVPSSLKEVVVTGSNSIAGDAFYQCKGLASVSFIGDVRVIGAEAFRYCTGLKTVTIPATCKIIGTNAFYDCVNLSDVYFSGTQAQKNINIGVGNDVFEDVATWHYESCTTHGGHTYKTTTTKATLTKNGSKVKRCTVCGYVADETTIKYAKSFSLSTTSYTYNGSVRTPNVTVKNANGTKLTKGTHYTVTYASGRKNAGTYKVTVKMKGNYSGTKTLTFKIKPASVSKCKVKLSATSYTYNGKVKTPSITVKNASGTKLKKGTDYTITYSSGRKNVGTYKVTIKMKGNYSGTKTLTFTIKPKAASVNKLTAKSKAIKVKLNRSLKQSTGYQIQYSTSKKFTNAKTKAVSSYKTSVVNLTGLKAKTTYYVRVRTYKTVNGKKIYSNWSSYKHIKTK